MSSVTMRYAIISDLHSNVEAVTNVLADIKSQGVEDIICLGDVVGYGPQPREVLHMAMNTVRVSLMGNHDEAVLKGAKNFNAWAREAIDWTREEIQTKDGRESDRWAYLKRMPLSFQTNGLYFVHGSPRQPTIEYILREDIYNGAYDKFDEIFASFEKVPLSTGSRRAVANPTPTMANTGVSTSMKIRYSSPTPREGTRQPTEPPVLPK